MTCSCIRCSIQLSPDANHFIEGDKSFQMQSWMIIWTVINALENKKKLSSIHRVHCRMPQGFYWCRSLEKIKTHRLGRRYSKARSVLSDIIRSHFLLCQSRDDIIKGFRAFWTDFNLAVLRSSIPVLLANASKSFYWHVYFLMLSSFWESSLKCLPVLMRCWYGLQLPDFFASRTKRAILS
jgi:hypothetical protein